MKKIIMLMLCVFFSHAYADDKDIDFQNRYQYGNWKHDKVTPYNTAGSTQPDYYNSSKYNVNSSRDVTSNGSKYKQTVNVAVEASKAEKAATIANRAKNMADYAKKLGKASIPAFVGSAALTALINGVGWVMDEGGKLTKIPDNSGSSTVTPADPTIYYSPDVPGSHNSESAVHSAVKKYFEGWGYYNPSCSFIDSNPYTGRPAVFYWCNGTTENGSKFDYGIRVVRYANPNYDPDYVQQPVEVPLDEMADLLQKAMDKSSADNNQALASAIAQAIKEAFSESDLDKNPNTGEKNNPIAEKTKKALDEKGAAEITEDADPTVCVPNIGDLDGSCTNMPKSQADALPTLQCVNRPIISANHCVYEVDPNAPTKPGTIEKPKVNPETGELPEACVWFDVHCKWLDWTKDDDLSEDTELDLDKKNEPEANTEIKYSGICPADKSVQFPAPFNFSVNFSYEPVCSVAQNIKPAVIAIGFYISALIIGGIRGAD